MLYRAIPLDDPDTDTVILWSIREANFDPRCLLRLFFSHGSDNLISDDRLSLSSQSPPVPVVLYCRGEMTLRDLINFKINKIYQLSSSTNNSRPSFVLL